MTRRNLLAVLPCVSSGLPTDSSRINAFAAAFNAYTDTLKQGKADIGLWRKVEEAWKGL